MTRSNSATAALDFAQQQVAWYRENEIELLGVRLRLLDAHDGEKFAAYTVAHFLAIGVIAPAQALQNAQAGDPLFNDALRLLARAQIRDELTLAPELRDCVDAALATPARPRRSRRRETNYFRDLCLTLIAQQVRDEFGLSLTGRSARRTSACGVVAEAMAMPYETVHKAVINFSKLA